MSVRFKFETDADLWMTIHALRAESVECETAANKLSDDPAHYGVTRNLRDKAARLEVIASQLEDAQ